jgi:hypothetical protein
MAGARDTALTLVRELCLALPGASERPSHGSPAFFIDRRHTFVMFLDDHHGDGRLAIWCAAPPGAQALLTASAPERYFVPPYVGHRGWIGLRLDRDATRDEIAGVIEDAWLDRAPKRRLAELDERT